MAFQEQPRAFVRAEGEEEITPPCSKTRSFDDSLSVAHLLQAKLDPTAKAAAASDDGDLPGPGSPSIDAAAAMLTNVQTSSQSGGMDKAVDCLMSLAAFGGSAKPPASGPPSSKKRRHASLSSSQAAGNLGDATSTRRRLAMRPPGKSPRPRSTSPGQQSAFTATADLHAAETSAFVPPLAAAEVAHTTAASPPCLSVTGIAQPVRLLSGANLQQLKLLSAAFKLCPSPTAEQLVAIAHRVSLSAEKLDTWFQSRRTLEDWIAQQPHLQPADIATMFFEGEDGQACAASARPSPQPLGC